MSLASYTPQSQRELLEVHASVFLFGPDKFDELINLPGERITLDMSFDWLHRGVDHVYRKPRHDAIRPRMHEVLDAIYAEFKVGRISEARIMCHDFEALVSDTRP